MDDRQHIYRKNFWEKIEKELFIIIPSHIKNVCRIQNFDNFESIKGIDEDAIMELEQFARKSIYKSQITANSNLTDYYGIYANHADDFEFTVGDKILLKKIEQFVTENNIKLKKSVKRQFPKNTTNCDKTVDNRRQISRCNTRTKKETKKILKLLKTNLNDIIEIEIQIHNKKIQNALILCTNCEKNIKVTKINNRWNLYNFRRHVGSHKKKTTRNTKHTKKANATTSKNKTKRDASKNK